MNMPRKQSRYRPTKPLYSGPPAKVPPKTLHVFDTHFEASRQKLALAKGYPSFRAYYLAEVVRPGSDPRTFKYIR
jgi:hypothetical protein